MIRRDFLKVFLLLPFFANAYENKKKSWLVLKSSADIIFPASIFSKSATELGVIEYLKEAIKSKYFPKREKKIILNGAKELEGRYKFLSLDTNQKEKAIKKFSKTPQGRVWLIVYTRYILEGIFCHPIYGGNIDKNGWREFGFVGGKPEPKKRYGLGRV